VTATGPAVPKRKRNSFLFLARLDGAGRVWFLTFVIAMSAIALFLTSVRGQPALEAPFHISWWMLVVLFYLAEVFVVHIQFQRDAHSVSLGELPLVLGLFFAAPAGLVLAQVVGDALALAIHRRQSPVKFAFNVCHFAFETCLAAALFHWIVSFGDPIGPAGWIATGVAVMASSVVGVLVICAAISLSEGRAQFSILPQMLGTGSIVTLANGSIALAVVTVAWTNPRAAWVLLVPAAVLFVGYRAYTAVMQRHDGLEFLYEAIRTFHRSPRPGEEALLELLSHTRRMFKAETAELIFLPSGDGEPATRTSLGPGDELTVMEPLDAHPADRDVAAAMDRGRSVLIARPHRGRLASSQSVDLRDAMISPIPGQAGVVGAIVVGNRLGDISEFDERDLNLLETLAQHLGVSLESARLGILQAEVAQLNEINQMKDDLIASTSHELRTPLTSIQGFVKTLLRPDVHLSVDEQRSFLETVARQSDRLTHMVEDLLTASRLESERIDLALASVSVPGLVLRVIDEVRPQAGDHRFDLRLEEATPDVLSDAERIQQILLNLIVNAIKYSPRATTITVEARAHDEGVLVSVRDQGGGIPPESQERIFDRFYQVDQSATRPAAGVGLGLYICRKLSESLGGRLWLERSDAEGSAFELWIPPSPPGGPNGRPQPQVATA
jgi:signal transduction histidine kinase